MILLSQNSHYYDPEMKRPELFHYAHDRLVLNLMQSAVHGWTILPEKKDNYVKKLCIHVL